MLLHIMFLTLFLETRFSCFSDSSKFAIAMDHIDGAVPSTHFMHMRTNINILHLLDAFYASENKYKHTSPVGLIMCRTETISVIYYQNFTSLLFWNISIISSDIGHLLNVLSSTKTNKNEFIILQIMNELTTISS